MNQRLQIPKPNLVDRVVRYFNPKSGLARIQARTALGFIDGTTGYVVPGSARRSMRGWNPRSGTADDDTLGVLDRARAGSRDLYMNTPLVPGALRRIRTNVVGAGLSLQCRVDRELLGLSDEAADAWERTTEREFRLWAESKDCDASRFLDFQGLQGLALFSTLMNGDCFAVLPFLSRESPQQPYQLAIQLIEADQVCNPNNALDTNKIAAGIEVDDRGAPVAYHILKKQFNMLASSQDWTRIPTYGERSGRVNILHLLEKERVGQRRGMPLFAPVVETLKQVTRLSEAELMGAIIASFFTVFVKTMPGGYGLQQGYAPEETVLNDSGDGTSGSGATNTDNNLYEIGSGNIVELGENEDVSVAKSERPNAAFQPFYEAMVRQVGAAIEVPYDQLMLVFSSSYSASRAALLEAWKYYRGRRSWLARNFCQPIYAEWLTEAIGMGRISAPGYFEDPLTKQGWQGAAWGGPGQGQIDPIKETKGAILRVQGNLGTYEDEYTAIHGGDWESAMERRGRENRKLEEEGLGQATEEEPAVQTDNAAEQIEEGTTT
jgi:lambda family phage portal protein